MRSERPLDDDFCRRKAWSMTEPRLTRSTFLKRALTAGALLSVPEFVTACERLPEELGKRKLLLPGKGRSFAEVLPGLLEHAASAPNPHNTQAWKIKILSDGLLLHIDPDRMLPETDPPGRQIHLGQGTFLETLRVASAAAGWALSIELFPEGETNPEVPGKRPVALVKFRPDPSAGDDLFDAVPIRATNRSAYEGPLISDEETALLARLTTPRASRLEILRSAEDLRRYADLFISAFSVETLSERRHEESRKWFRYSDEEILSQKDGISLRGNGLSGFRLWIARKFFVEKGKENWHSDGNRKGGVDMFREQAQSARGLAFFRTATNTPRDWVECGRDVARFYLAATKMGLAVHPMNQIIQEYPEMDELRAQFESLTDSQAPSKIQMIFRLGRSSYRYASPRRPVEDLMS